MFIRILLKHEEYYPFDYPAVSLQKIRFCLLLFYYTFLKKNLYLSFRYFLKYGLASYEITNFTHSPGIFFNKLGPLGYYDSPLQIVLHQDLSAFKNQLKMVDQSFEYVVNHLNYSDITENGLYQKTSRWDLIHSTISTISTKKSNNLCTLQSFSKNVKHNGFENVVMCDENTYVLKNPNWDNEFNFIQKLGEKCSLLHSACLHFYFSYIFGMDIMCFFAFLCIGCLHIFIRGIL